MLKKILATMLLITALPATAAGDEVQRFYGYAYDQKSGKFLYTEVHEQRSNGDRWLGGTMKYFDPQGKQIGKKTLDFSKDSYIPLYHLVLSRDGFEEGISAITSDKVEIFKRSSSDKPVERKQVDRVSAMAADSGFHAYIRANFADLMAGKTVAFKLVAAGNLDAFKFRIKRIEDGSFENATAVRFRVEPDSMLRFVIDPLELSYEAKTRKLLEYRGIANIHDGKGNPYVARIAYYSKPPADGPKTLPPLQ